MPALKEVWVPSPGVGVSVEALEEFNRYCVKNSEHDFVSGGHGTSYVDLDELFGTRDREESDRGLILQPMVERIESLKAEGYNVLAFAANARGPEGIVSARLLVASQTGLQTMVIRPDKRLLSQAAKPATLPSDARVLIVTDVATTGRSIWRAAEVLWMLGARRCGALAIADREEGAEQFLSSLDIPLYSIVKPSKQQAA